MEICFNTKIGVKNKLLKVLKIKSCKLIQKVPISLYIFARMCVSCERERLLISLI